MDGKGYGCYGLAILLLILLGSCMERPGVTQTLLQVEQLMEYDADSALLLLHQIPHPDKLRTKQRADYALLLTQAQDKTFLDSLQSDSLISIATQYYAHRKDYLRAGKAFFYHGKVQVLQGSDSLALHSYLKAEELLRKTDDYRTRALVHEHIGKINLNHRLYEDAKDNFRIAINLAEIIADTLILSFNYNHLASVYLAENNIDSARYAVNWGLDLLGNRYTFASYPALMHLSGYLEHRKGNFEQAIYRFRQAIKFSRGRNISYHYQMSLGSVYLSQNDFEKAAVCFVSILQSSSPWTCAGAYHYLYKLEKKRKNYYQALVYKEKSDSLVEIDDNISLQGNLFRLQKASQSKDQLKEKKLLIYQNALYASLGVCFALLCIIIYIRYKRTMKRHIQILAEKDLDILQYWAQIKDLKRRKKTIGEEYKKHREDLEQQIQTLLTENIELRNAGASKGLVILNGLRTYNLSATHLSKTEKLELYKLVDLVYDNFATYLREKYSLTTTTLLFPILIKLGFSTDELCTVLDCDKEALRKRKLRLKAVFNLSEEEKLDVFLMYLSSKMSQKNK